ncbi:MAG: NAD(P)/FAD-dependent oxidoreductase [Acidobacteriota bacterium]|nr:MAG: NAD(P)/FAD-dependent oxidoreductase [Acidobacteriota bacterium]
MTNRDYIRSRYHAVVVGARVAGASTAMLLARSGMRVLAVESSAAGSDTLSTHALMRAGVLQLHRWGVLERIRQAGTPAIRRTTFHYGEEKIAVDIKERDGIDALFAPRRTVLDPALVEAALEAGADVVHKATVTGLLTDAGGRVHGVDLTDSTGNSHRIEADIVIGADGARSNVARAVGAEVLRRGLYPASFIYGYWRGLELDGSHWQYLPELTAGAIPTNDDTSCIFIGMRPGLYEDHRRQGLDKLYSNVLFEVDPDLASAVGRAEQLGKLYPFAGRPGFIRQSWGPGWALVGDAACFKDPLTAHGITDALRDAELLSMAVIEGTDRALAAYQLERDAYAVEFLDLSDEIASFDWDLDRLKTLHLRLSKLMNRECDLVRSFDPVLAETACP